MLLIPGKYYHIYNRGNNQETIFKEKRNYAYFLSLWKKHIVPVADTYAYFLWPNHFHFLIRVKDAPDEAISSFSKKCPDVLRTILLHMPWPLINRAGVPVAYFKKTLERVKSVTQ